MSHFVVPEDAYSVLTPYGTLAAFFPDDGPVLWTGDQEARDYFAAMLRSFTPPSGFGYTMETLGEDDLVDMPVLKGWSILVREPRAVVQAEIEALRSGQVPDSIAAITPPPDPENAPKWPVLNPVKLADL